MEELLELACATALSRSQEQAAQVTNTVFAFVRELREVGVRTAREA